MTNGVLRVVKHGSCNGWDGCVEYGGRIQCVISPAIFAQVPRELRYDVENNSLAFLLKFLRPCRISNVALWSHKLFAKM